LSLKNLHDNLCSKDIGSGLGQSGCQLAMFVSLANELIEDPDQSEVV
jgi:hypothetical protein